MYMYEVMYSRLGENRDIIRLICLGEQKRFKAVFSDYAYAAYFFSSDEPMDQVYAKYFDGVKQRYTQKIKNKSVEVFEPNTEKFVSAVSLASKGSYTYVCAMDPNYRVPYLSSGRKISDVEMQTFHENFPCGIYMTPKNLLSSYEVIILM